MEQIIDERKIFLKYCILQGAFWAGYCGLSNFAALILGGRGFTSAQIGMVMAVGGTLSAVLQPYTGAVADSLKRITIQQFCAVFLIVIGAVSFAVAAVPTSFLSVAGLFIASYAGMQIAAPILNAVSMSYVNSGIRVDFGAARACGSAVYATVSILLGNASNRWGANVCAVSSGILFLLASAVVLSMQAVSGSSAAQDSARTEQASLAAFVGKYRQFMVVVVGLTMIMIFHFLINNYMIYAITPLGGTAANMGIAVAIAAIAELPGMLFFTRLNRHFSVRALLTCSCVFFVVKAAGHLLAGTVTAFYGVQLIQALTYSLFAPGIVYYVNETMEPGDRFKGQSIIMLTNTVGSVLASLIGGFILEQSTVRTMLWVQLVFAAAGTVLVLIGFRGRKQIFPKE